MNKQKIESYTEAELFKGRSKQEIFNFLAANSDYNIPILADVIRKVPTPAKRKEYEPGNIVLLCLLALSILGNMITLYSLIMAETEPIAFPLSLSSLAPILITRLISIGFLLIYIAITVLLFYGLYRYKRHTHYITAFLMVFWSVATLPRIILQGDLLSFIGIVLSALGAIIAFYLAFKLPDDYILNKDLLEKDPPIRVDSAIFME